MKRVLLAALLVGCSSGGGGGATPAAVAPATSAPAPPSPSPSPDAALQAALATAGVTALQRPAPEAPELVALGRALFFDKILSGNKNISCAGCHDMGAATGDGLPVAMGTGATGSFPQRTLATGRLIGRNAPPIFNTAGMDTLFWDSRVQRDPATGNLLTPDFLLNGATPGRPQITAQLGSALAAQAMFPVTVAEEMRGQVGTNELANAASNEDVWTLLMARLVGTKNGTAGGLPGYRALFAAAYPAVTSFDAFNFGHAARAMAAFERVAFAAVDTHFDAYLAGDPNALTPGQKRGALLFFGKARCSSCHSGPLLTDQAAHALAVPQLGPGKSQPNEDLGRALITGAAADDYKFRTPPLRNVAASGPWMHDGAFVTLESAVRHHLDPAAGIKAYDASQLPALFAATVDTDPARIAARIAALDPKLGAPLALTNDELGDVIDFLGALTDPTSLNALQSLVPATVPSGLAVPN